MACIGTSQTLSESYRGSLSFWRYADTSQATGERQHTVVSWQALRAVVVVGLDRVAADAVGA
eukprot:4293985-Prymnesium_polylepis.1